jgi:DNA-binding transcriptional LysR family regulator
VSARRVQSGCDWQAIEVRHLAALAAVAGEGSFRRAADRLGYVQSAISGQIAYLERAVGARLLTRASGTPVVELTAEGEVLLRHTNEILARFDSARTHIGSLSRRTVSVLRVAGLEHFAPLRVADILSRLRQRHPFARVVLDARLPTASTTELLRGEVDVLICELAAAPEAVSYEVVETGGYVLLASAGSVLAATTEPISPTGLAALRPIIPSTCGGRGLNLHLRRLGVASHPYLKAESVRTAQALVGFELGEAIVPARLVDPTDWRVVAIDLGHLLPPYATVAAWKPQGQTLIIHDFVSTVRETDTEGTDDTDSVVAPVETAIT